MSNLRILLYSPRNPEVIGRASILSRTVDLATRANFVVQTLSCLVAKSRFEVFHRIEKNPEERVNPWKRYSFGYLASEERRREEVKRVLSFGIEF